MKTRKIFSLKSLHQIIFHIHRKMQIMMNKDLIRCCHEIEGDRIIPVNTFSNELNLNNIRSLNTMDKMRTEDMELFLDLPEKNIE